MKTIMIEIETSGNTGGTPDEDRTIYNVRLIDSYGNVTMQLMSTWDLVKSALAAGIDLLKEPDPRFR